MGKGTLVFAAIIVVVIILAASALYFSSHPVSFSNQCKITNSSTFLSPNFLFQSNSVPMDIFNLSSANPKNTIFKVTVTQQDYSPYGNTQMIVLRNLTFVTKQPLVPQSSYVIPNPGYWRFEAVQQKHTQVTNTISNTLINATVNITLEDFKFQLSGC